MPAVVYLKAQAWNHHLLGKPDQITDSDLPKSLISHAGSESPYAQPEQRFMDFGKKFPSVLSACVHLPRLNSIKDLVVCDVISNGG